MAEEQDAYRGVAGVRQSRKGASSSQNADNKEGQEIISALFSPSPFQRRTRLVPLSAEKSVCA